MRAKTGKLDGASTASAELQGLDAGLAEAGRLRRERDALMAEVEALKKRVEELEANAAHVRNRLAWAIDSVQTLLDGKG